MNVSVVPSSFPAPIAPDFYKCDEYYAFPTNATYEDCQIAFNYLPTGSDLIHWASRYNRDDPHSLPFVVTYRQ